MYMNARIKTMAKQVEIDKKLPFLPGLPIVGSFSAFFNDRLNVFLKMAQLGDVSGAHLGPLTLVQLNKPEHVRLCLVEQGEKIRKPRSMHAIMKSPVSGREGLFISEGALHHRQRALMAPSFQPRHISAYADTMVHYGESLQQDWQEGETVDLNREMTRLTMRIVGKVLFDTEIKDEADELGAALTTSFGYTTYRLSNPFSLPLIWPTGRNLSERAAVRVLRDRIQQMIDEHQSHPDGRTDFLSILLNTLYDDGSKMDRDQLMEECLTLFSAGHETTASTLMWCWWELLHHPEMYQRLQNEAEQVLQGRAPTYADLKQLPYALQVFKEAMRLYPAGYVITREAPKDFVVDGYRIPEGSLVFVSPYVLHRNPAIFPDPEKFDPERFTPEREKQVPRYAYIPFGAGPRICIGNYFALMEGQLILATLAQRTNFSLLPGQSVYPDPKNNLTLRPSGPIKVAITKRSIV